MTNVFHLQYGGLVVARIEVTPHTIRVVQNAGFERDLDAEALAGLARNLLAAGTALNGVAAALAAADDAEERASSPPQTLAQLRAQLDELKLPSTPGTRFAKTLIGGLMTFTHETLEGMGLGEAAAAPADGRSRVCSEAARQEHCAGCVHDDGDCERWQDDGGGACQNYDDGGDE